jgi:Spy/CpxP family protein refolding chaperone
MRSQPATVVLVVVLVVATLHAPAAAQPATAPATAAADAAEGRVAALEQRFRYAIGQLDLSEDQKAQATRIADELRAGVRKAIADAQGDVQQLRTKVRELVNDARLDLQEVLTPEQQEKLRDLLEQRAPRPRPATGPDRPRMQDQPMSADEPPADIADTKRAATTTTARPAAAIVRVGQAAPDFTLDKLDGRTAQLSSFKGKLVVLLFGNYSSPTFRDRADDYEQLRRQVGNRAEFLIVYTRESHPVGEWEVERNKHARVLVEQPKTFDERKALARQAKQALKLTIPIAVDTMDDKVATEYGGFTTAAVIVGRDGTIVGFRRHADAHAIKRMLDDIAAGG